MYPRILYWKLAPDVLDPAVAKRKAEDIVNRSSFDLIYITSHALPADARLPQKNPALAETLTILRDVFHAHGRKMMFDYDIRMFVDFYKELGYTETLHMTRLCEGVLDKNGYALLIPGLKGKVHTTHTAGEEELRKMASVPVDGIFAAFAFRLVDGSHYIFKPETLVRIDDAVTVKDGALAIRLDPKYAGYTVAVFPSVNKAYFGDRTCPEYMKAERVFFEQMQPFGFDAAATDEWGLVTETERPTEECPYYSTSSINMTRHIIAKYGEMYGKDLAEEMVYLYFHPENDRGVAVAVYHRYLSVLRYFMASTDAEMYDMAKEFLGKDAFFGVHPTWWGTKTRLFMEGLHNGLDWWEVKRDYAQTDEEIIIPFRLSMSRTASEPLWYNMWYSMGTNDVKTFFRETYDNLRFAGRTHYLSYECREENGVLDMADSDALELCSEMDELLIRLNEFGAARPDTRVLTLFSYDAFTNPMLSDPGARQHLEHCRNVHRIISFTDELFRSPCLVELAPTTEIDRDKVILNENGRVSYYGKEYDALILLVPDGMSKKSLALCKEYAKRNGLLLTVGGMEYFSDGDGAEKEFASLATAIPYAFDFDVPVKDVLDVLDAHGIARNVSENYTVFEDGSVIFAPEGKLHRNNPLSVDTEVSGHRIRFEGADLLAVRFKDTPEFVYGEATLLEIDGKRYV